NAETDAINFVNLGIGINVNTPVSRLEGKTTSLKEKLGKEVSRKELFHSVVKEITKQQTLLSQEDLLKEWKQLSTTLNQEVKIVMPGEEIRGRAIDIDTNGALIIKRADGSLTRAFAGDCIHLL
ncbi:MAG: biotin--[acetyl-CoA-carboxylase] ligase, partial [Candidatus Atribacteria bacterium]|nr:biotin--[acetyl-CoA-carboxylase] ligase [Candidatus Atribacteria bacterium]